MYKLLLTIIKNVCADKELGIILSLVQMETLAEIISDEVLEINRQNQDALLENVIESISHKFEVVEFSND